MNFDGWIRIFRQVNPVMMVKSLLALATPTFNG